MPLGLPRPATCGGSARPPSSSFSSSSSPFASSGGLQSGFSSEQRPSSSLISPAPVGVSERMAAADLSQAFAAGAPLLALGGTRGATARQGEKEEEELSLDAAFPRFRDVKGAFGLAAEPPVWR